jgi:hypothetical protein
MLSYDGLGEVKDLQLDCVATEADSRLDSAMVYPNDLPEQIRDKLTNHRSFDFHGLQVEEMVFDNFPQEGVKGRVLWCLVPFNRLVSQGRKNMLVYTDFDPSNSATLTDARHKVAEEFKEFHKLKV